jgi:hypothetical protein
VSNGVTKEDRTMFKWTAIATVFAVALSATVACGGGDEKTIDVGNGDEVTISGDLPGDFPDDFPVYDGADLQGATEGEQEGIRGIVATWTTGDDFEDVRSFYENAFEGGAWNSAGSGNAGGTAWWSLQQGDGEQVGYVAVTDGDEVSIIATVGDDPNALAAGPDGDSSSTDDESSADGDSGAGDSGSGSGSGSSATELPDEVDLPDDFPSDRVPLPDDARLVAVNSVSSNGELGFALTVYASDSVEDLAQSYQGKLEGKGYSQTYESSDASGVYAAYSENSDGSGAVVTIQISEGDIQGYSLALLSVAVAAS